MAEKYIGKGYSGLKNLGNTCFINSCIQVLSHTYELNELLAAATYEKQIPETYLTQEYLQLIKIMWEDNRIVVPGGFLRALQTVAAAKKKEIFTGFAQNDTSELLMFLIDAFHTSISRAGAPAAAQPPPTNFAENFRAAAYEKEYSAILDLFYGVNISQILQDGEGAEAHTAPALARTAEFFFILDLPIPRDVENPTLGDCLEKFAECEHLTGDNKWFNEKTAQYEEVYKKYDICISPPILVILINRFNSPMQKNETLVKIPHVLILGDNTYDLYGICNHVGNPFFGHYTAFVKNAANEWLFYNDENIQKVDDPQKIITPMAYCLFYRRRPAASI
jgi:ubiquitin C-terminal hydrolase